MSSLTVDGGISLKRVNNTVDVALFILQLLDLTPES